MEGKEKQRKQSRTFMDVVYKTTSLNEELCLDIYLPPQHLADSGYPVLMIFHGGGWEGGDKKLLSAYRISLLDKSLKAGFAVVSVNYRLVNETTHFPKPVEDCADAVRWVRANALNYNFNPERIGIWGESAGAHLAMLVGYADSTTWSGAVDLKNYVTKINFIINNYGPVDLNALFHTSAGKLKLWLFRVFVSETFQMRNKLIHGMTSYNIIENKTEAIAKSKDFSPLYYISSNSVPTLIFHGTKDKLVPFSQSVLLLKKLQQFQVKHEFIKIKDGNHGFFNQNQQKIDGFVDKTIDFMKNYG